MHWIRSKLEACGSRTACHEAGKTYTYANFLALIDQAVAKLPAGERQVVEISEASSIKALASLLAVALQGHIALPLPPELPAAERERMREIAQKSPLYGLLDGSGLILFSSGTSGQPKGMLHNFDALLHRYQILQAREDRCLLLLLIDHIGGLDAAFRCLFSGSTLVIPQERRPEAAASAIQAHQVNVLPASPTFLNLMLLAHIPDSHDLSSVEIVAYGAEAMPQAVLRQLAKAFPKAQLQQKFGTSETGAVRIRSVGNESLFFRIEDPDTEWKIVESELWLKTPSRILGYLNAAPDNLEADGWYATGDLVETDHAGNLRIIGRASALINVGGQKVHPSEVETVLGEIEGVEACRIYGKTDPITGSAVACDLVVREGKDLRAWKRTIRNHCRGQLAPWKIPSHLRIIDKIELTLRMKRG